MEVSNDHSELNARLAAAGWQLMSLKEKGGSFIAEAQDATGDKVDRTGSSPKFALANLVMFVERRNQMRAYRSSWSTDWLGHHDKIADDYRKLPLFDHKAVPAWQALADESRAQADEIRRQVQVVPVNKHNAEELGVKDPSKPYSSPEEMRSDIRDNKRLLVSAEGTDHPVWSPQDVQDFRITHNVLGVGQSNAPEYSWRGANMAFQSHAPYLSPDARKAMFSEIIGQGAHHRHFRTFSPPRISTMDSWLDPAEGHEGHNSVNVTPTPVPAAGDQQEPGQWRSAALGEGPDADPGVIRKAIELFDAQVQRGEKPMSIFMGVVDQLMSMGIDKGEAMEASRKALLNHEDRNLAVQSGPAMQDEPSPEGMEFTQIPQGWTQQLEQMPVKRQGAWAPAVGDLVYAVDTGSARGALRVVSLTELRSYKDGQWHSEPAASVVHDMSPEEVAEYGQPSPRTVALERLRPIEGAAPDALPEHWSHVTASAEPAIDFEQVRDSIIANGGGTFDPVTMKKLPADDGFAVAIMGIGQNDVKFTKEGFTPEAIEGYYQHNSALAQSNDAYLGSWFEDGMYWLDVSRWIPDRMSAIVMAVDNLQIAIFDIAADDDLNILDSSRSTVLPEIVEECLLFGIDINAHLARAHEHWAGGSVGGSWNPDKIGLDGGKWEDQFPNPDGEPDAELEVDGEADDEFGTTASYTPTLQDPNRNWKSNLAAHEQAPAIPSGLMPSGEPNPDGPQDGPEHDYIERQKVEHNAHKNIPRWHDPESDKMLPWWDSRVPTDVQDKAILNAFKMAILSPQKHLKWNAAHFQELMDMPADAKGHELHKKLDGARRDHNEALGHDPDGHLSYWKSVKDYADRLAVKENLDPRDALEKARKRIFDYTVEAENLLFDAHREAGIEPKDELSMMTAAKAIVTHWVEGTAPSHSHRQVKLKKPVGDRTHKKVKKTPDEYKTPIDRLTKSPFDFPKRKNYKMAPPTKRKRQPTVPPPSLLDQIESSWRFADQGGLWSDERPSVLPDSSLYGDGIPKGDANPDAKYGMFYTSHLRSIEMIGQHIDKLRDAALADIQSDGGRGRIFRSAVHELGVGGASSKVASFVWLMLTPMTSELGVLDTHMARVFNVPEDEIGSKRDYFKFERMQQAAKDATGYQGMPLGLYHWGLWDLARSPDPETGKPMHSDHQALRPLSPADWRSVKWEGSVAGKKADSENSTGQEFVDPPHLARARPILDRVAQEFDETVGQQPKSKIPTVAGWAPSGWTIQSGYFNTNKQRKLKLKLKSVKKTDAGARSLAREAHDIQADKKDIRKALKGESKTWTDKVLKEHTKLKRMDFGPSAIKALKRLR